MARKRKTKPTDYDNLTTDEIRVANERLTAYLAERVARNERGDHQPMTLEEIECILIAAGPRGYKKVFDDIVDFAATLASDDPTPAQPLRPGDAGAIVDAVTTWLAQGSL